MHSHWTGNRQIFVFGKNLLILTIHLHHLRSALSLGDLLWACISIVEVRGNPQEQCVGYFIIFSLAFLDLIYGCIE